MAPAEHATHAAPWAPHSDTEVPVTHVPRSEQHPEQFDASHVEETPQDTDRRATASRRRIK